MITIVFQNLNITYIAPQLSVQMGYMNMIKKNPENSYCQGNLLHSFNNYVWA